ncbi:helix-turn-helix domain-containing protein [Nonomuraea montanisoli]|uniref:helix-turn-helix domain-containing protein n=1 Tax=Nonomuraea montanisoli TaxID=2741721 RepID=UPI0038B2CA75
MRAPRNWSLWAYSAAIGAVSRARPAPVHHEGKPLDDAAASELVARMRASAGRAGSGAAAQRAPQGWRGWSVGLPSEAAARVLWTTPTETFTPVAMVADLATRAALSAPAEGRAPYAGLRALDVPEEPVARLWHAATLLRERGDGHNAVLLAHGIAGTEAHGTSGRAGSRRVAAHGSPSGSSLGPNGTRRCWPAGRIRARPASPCWSDAPIRKRRRRRDDRRHRAARELRVPVRGPGRGRPQRGGGRRGRRPSPGH